MTAYNDVLAEFKCLIREQREFWRCHLSGGDAPEVICPSCDYLLNFPEFVLFDAKADKCIKCRYKLMCF